MPIIFQGSSASLQALANTDITPANALNVLIEDMAPDLRLQGARTIRALIAAGRARDIQQTRQDWIVRGPGAETSIYPTENVTVVNSTDTTHKAHIEIGEYKIAHRMRVNRVALQEAANRGPQAIQDLFAEQLFSGLRVIHKRMNTLLYTGNGTPATANMNGLLMGYNAAVPFEGIDSDDLPEWSPIVLGNGGVLRRLTRDLMRDFDTLVSLEEVGYNFVVMNPETAKAYSKEYDNIAGTLNAQGRAGGDNVVANAELGYFGKTFNGISILEDPECPVNAIYAMDLTTVQLLFFLLDNNPASPNVNPIIVNRTYGFPIHIAELTTPVSTVREVEMYVMPQVRITNRRGLLGITDIDPELSFETDE